MEEVQNPVKEGGIDAKVTEFGDHFGGDDGDDGVEC